MLSDFKGRVAHLARGRQIQIPTLPVVIHGILRLAGDDRASTKDLAEFIGRDQAIAARVLRLANSAYYSRLRKVETISRAVSVVGFSQVMSLAMGMRVFSAVQMSGARGSLDITLLWMHSLACCFASRQIVSLMERGRSTEGRGFSGQPLELPVYLGALLHDIGKAVYALHFPEELKAVLKAAKDSGEPLDSVERRVLETDHAALAGQMMDAWNFPDSIALPVRHHHNPQACRPEHRTAAAIVSLADYVAHKARIGGSGNACCPFPRSAVRMLKLHDADVPVLVRGLKEHRPGIQKFLTLMR
ncbi:MAG: HDOD domain-containing protein [Syntrophobacteraceae bacterium]|nr:HDOD domain-containing protein [Desulfobacteraceae bacterium]